VQKANIGKDSERFLLLIGVSIHPNGKGISTIPEQLIGQVSGMDTLLMAFLKENSSIRIDY
jgi:hypothetical protein